MNTDDSEILDLENLFHTRGGTYVLRVKGKALEPEGLFEGDYVIIERASTAVLGQLALYRLSDLSCSLRRTSDALPVGGKVEGVLIGALRTYPKIGGAA